LFALRTAASESTCASSGRGQLVDRLEGNSFDTRHNHLGNAHPARHRKYFGAKVHQGYHQLAPVVAIDGGRRIRQRNAVPER
jgi:hypothetical protein